jgi:hypothetical protein
VKRQVHDAHHNEDQVEDYLWGLQKPEEWEREENADEENDEASDVESAHSIRFEVNYFRFPLLE